MNAGALHPSLVRHTATPRPCLAPKMKPALTRCGTTTMHCDPFNTSSGMPLSGAAPISLRAVAELCSRAVASSRAEPAQARFPSNAAKLSTTRTRCRFMPAPLHKKILVPASSRDGARKPEFHSSTHLLSICYPSHEQACEERRSPRSSLRGCVIAKNRLKHDHLHNLAP